MKLTKPDDEGRSGCSVSWGPAFSYLGESPFIECLWHILGLIHNVSSISCDEIGLSPNLSFLHKVPLENIEPVTNLNFIITYGFRIIIETLVDKHFIIFPTSFKYTSF
jgi:hypothetical protein